LFPSAWHDPTLTASPAEAGELFRGTDRAVLQGANHGDARPHPIAQLFTRARRIPPRAPTAPRLGPDAALRPKGAAFACRGREPAWRSLGARDGCAVGRFDGCRLAGGS